MYVSFERAGRVQTNVMDLEDDVRSGAARSAASAKPRVLFLINSLEGGGAERVMCTLLRSSEAQRAEFDMTLALLDDEKRANEPPDWIEVRQLDCEKSMLKSVLSVRQLLSELNPDVTVSFLTRANIASLISARAPAIVSERANTTAHFSRPAGIIPKTLVRVTYPKAARIISVSEGVTSDLIENYGVRGDRVETIPNPVDIELIEAQAALEPALDLDEPYFFAAGRLSKSKNFGLLIHAFAVSGLDGKLVIAGEGTERANLEQIAREGGVLDRVVFPGFVANPYSLMRRARACVLSSNVEGFPNALVEAMAAGAPVIATNCASGPSEILADAPRESIDGLTFAKNGVLTPTNDVVAMAQALRSFEDEARRLDYAAKAKVRAQDFKIAAATTRYWAVIREALAARV
jgi:N-acetylgalactosamine-N,N'-diacetylbacillosaminyl-diphospho-undecaprenol 4-alpha-N-acetylgalactosaminyltransferase